MPTYNYPGVYIEEKPSGPGPIRGVSPSGMGLIGWTDRGPVDEPILCTSFPEYSSKFGGFTGKGLAPTMAYAAYANGLGELYMVRVAHDDAVKSWSDLVFEMSALVPEPIDNAVSPSGLYTGTLLHAPIVPGTVHITFENTAVPLNVNSFIDPLGDGVLSADPLAPGSGGSGSIDYATGDFSIQLAVPGEFTGVGVDQYVALYNYRVLRFQMKWPGVQGDFYRVIIQGAPDYLVAATAHYTRFNILVEEDVAQDPTAPVWNTSESFDAVVLDDASDPNYIVTVMNDKVYGSSIVNVLDYGNAMNPPNLAGVHIGAAPYPVEDFRTTQQHSDGTGPTPNPYDGAWKGWSYRVNAPGALSGVFETTFYPQFWFSESALRIGTGANPANPVPILNWSPAAIVSATAVITCDLTVGGVGFTLTTNALGQVLHGAVVVGSINYATGVIAIDLTPVVGESFVANSAILLECDYAEPVTLHDDGNGNLFVANPGGTDIPGGPYTATPTKFSVDPNGTNTVDYVTGDFTVTWKLAGDPAAGPAGLLAHPPVGIVAETADYYTNPASALRFPLANGDDGSMTDSGDLVDPSLAAEGRALWAFGKADAIMNLVAADFQTDPYVDDALLTYAELMKDKFVIMTYPHGLEVQEAVNWKKYTLAKFSSRGALYGPHIKIKDPVTDSAIDVPCGGHVAGIYARTDQIRNVGEAPAGMQKAQLNWLLGLEQSLSRAQVGILTDANINALVDWPQTGRCVWGARTIDAAGSEWGYLQARRLFMFLEKSVFNATHIHVFENNGPALWARIRSQVVSFLTTLYQQQYFAGSSPDDAFFVICDSTNNPQNTVDMGLVFCDIGVAPNKPAEFIVFRFQQKAL